MKLQAKSLFSSLGLAREGRAGTARPGSGSNLQTFSTDLHESTSQGVFEYPRNWVLIAKVAAVMLMALAIIRVIAFLRPIMQVVTAGRPIERAGISFWEVIGTAAAGVVAFALAGLLLALFPTVRVTPQGLGVSELFGWRRISWNQIGKLRVMDLGNEQYVVLVPFRGQTRPPTPAPVFRLIPLLLGYTNKGEHGVFLSSYISDFDRMVQLMVSYMGQAAGQRAPRVELFLDETARMPLAQLALQPDAAIMRMARPKPAVDAYGMPLDQVEQPVNWREVLTKQAWLAIPSVVMLLVTVTLRHGSSLSMTTLFWAAFLLGLGVLELPFAGKLVQSVGDMMVGNGQFKGTVMTYLDLQVPRAVMVMAGVAMLGIGMPASVAQICWLAGIGVTTWLLNNYVQRAYYINTGQTLMATLGVLVYQIAILALYIGLS